MSRKNLEVEKVVMESPPVTLFRLAGALTGTPESYEFLDMLREHTSRAPGPVILNLEKLGQVNSSGVGILAACYTSIINTGSRACLAAPPQRLRTILDVVKLTSCFCVLDSEEEAIDEIS